MERENDKCPHGAIPASDCHQCAMDRFYIASRKLSLAELGVLFAKTRQRKWDARSEYERLDDEVRFLHTHIVDRVLKGEG